ncbi:MAG: pantoate--beta-alanine ligase, partial [bacterium]
TKLYRSLKKGEEMIFNGENNTAKIEEKMINMIKDEELAEIDYVKIVDPETLGEIAAISEEVLLALAVYIGETRLIDNFYIKNIKND